MNFIQKHGLKITGVCLGAIAGYAYFYFIGCHSGSCAITSQPLNSTGYGMVMGYLIFSLFEPTKKKSV